MGNTITTDQFLEILKIINCMEYKELVAIFGKDKGCLISSKRSGGVGIKFLFELEQPAFDEICKYAIKKLNK